MSENEAPREDKAQEESGSEDEGPNWGERPDSPEPGHPADETQPIGGVPPRLHDEPQDIPPPPRPDEDEQERTETPGAPTVHDEPQEIAPTPREDEDEQERTETPGSHPDPESG